MKKYITVIMLLALACSGCATGIPKSALQLSPQTLADRQIQTRKFETTNNVTMLRAASGVLQDLGFTLEESEVPLGVLVGAKTRDATSGAQIAGAILLAALSGVPQTVDDTQHIRVSMVMRTVEKGAEHKSDASKLPPNVIATIRNEIKKDVANSLRKYYSKEVCQQVADQMAQNTEDALTKSLLSASSSVKEDAGVSTVRVTFQRVVVDTQGKTSRAEQIKDPKIYQEFFERLSKSVFLEAHEI